MNRYRAQLRTSLFFGTAVFIVAALILVDRLLLTGPVHAQASWRGLVVAPEQRCAPYDPDDYRYPQSVEDRIVAELGGVYAPYTGRWFASDSETDIEHIVARSEAHDSGLCAADVATKRRFATDLLNLTLAGPRVNRYQKVDNDAAAWLPPQNRCWYAARIIAVRQQYGAHRRPARSRRAGSSPVRLRLNGDDRVRAWCTVGACSSGSRLCEGHRGVGRQRQRADQLRRGASTRDRPGHPGSPGVSVHAGWRRRRRRLRVREQSYVTDEPCGPASACADSLWSLPQLHCAQARSSQRRPSWALRVSTPHGS